VTYRKYATRVPDEVAYGIYEWFSSQLNTLHIIKRIIQVGMSDEAVGRTSCWPHQTGSSYKKMGGRFAATK